MNWFLFSDARKDKKTYGLPTDVPCQLLLSNQHVSFRFSLICPILILCHPELSMCRYGLGLNTQTRMPEKYQGWEGPSWTQVMGCSTSDQLDLYAACSKFGKIYLTVIHLVELLASFRFETAFRCSLNIELLHFNSTPLEAQSRKGGIVIVHYRNS